MKERVLLNISNHPSDEWSTEQMQAALKDYSDVEDFAHPPVSPEMTSDQVLKLALKVNKEVQIMDPAAVHVMGEHTFCYTLVRLLQQDGYVCIASTTIRSVQKINDNEIRRTFVFSGFRLYPTIDGVRD